MKYSMALPWGLNHLLHSVASYNRSTLAWLLLWAFWFLLPPWKLLHLYFTFYDASINQSSSTMAPFPGVLARVLNPILINSALSSFMFCQIESSSLRIQSHVRSRGSCWYMMAWSCSFFTFLSRPTFPNWVRLNHWFGDHEGRWQYILSRTLVDLQSRGLCTVIKQRGRTSL